MICCTVVKKKKQSLKHLPLVIWSRALLFNLTNQVWNISFWAVMKSFLKYKGERGGVKRRKGWWKQASAGPHPRGQSKGSIAMPTVGTQLERNVDAETPTSGALPRTSNPAVLSLSVALPPNSTMSENLPPPSPTPPAPNLSCCISLPRFALILSLSLTCSLWHGSREDTC